MNKENAGEGEQVGAIGRVFCVHTGQKSVGGLMRQMQEGESEQSVSYAE